MAPMSRFRGPSAFRPGIVLQRPMFPPRLMPAASHRTPFIVYRSVPHRYAVKPMNPVSTRNVFGIPWKTTHIPVPVTPEYDYARAASSQAVIRTDGAIHTIPAPNLSLSEKPIVVADFGTSENGSSLTIPEQDKPTYEVTEKNSEAAYNVQAKIETPTGFYKPNSGINYEYKNTHNDVSQQFNPDYGLIQVQQQLPSIVPQEFSMQRFNGLPSHQDLIHAGAEGIIIPPNALLQSDPTFLQKLQTQILQTYPSVEFIPYNPDLQSQIQTQTEEAYYYKNGQFIKKEPMAFVPSDANRNIVQRKTQEGTVQSLMPQSFQSNNVTESHVDLSTTYTPENTISSIEIIVNETQTATPTTETIVETKADANTKKNKRDEMHSIHAAINDMNEISSEKSINSQYNTTVQNLESTTETMTTTQEVYTNHYLDNKDRTENNEIIKDYKNFVASPFEKPAESVNIAYSLLRVTEPAPTVENTTKTEDKVISSTTVEYKEIHRDRSLMNRTPVRFTLPEKRTVDESTQPVIKAKIPPKSKLIYDDKTGEPILRVYASYLDNPARKEVVTQKLSNMRLSRESTMRKQENNEHLDAATVNGLASDVNQYGLKIKPRNDANRDIILEEYNL